MGVRQEQRERTRAHLLSVAHGLFADRGYADVGLAELVAGAGVTKGALYHHFDGKLAVFSAVVADVAAAVGDRVAARAEAAADPWDGLDAGCEEFLRAATAPDAVRVLLLDAPAVLGWQRWHELDDRTSVAHLRAGLAEVLPGVATEPLVRSVSGALNGAALWIATLPAADRETAIADCAGVVRRLLGTYRDGSRRDRRLHAAGGRPRWQAAGMSEPAPLSAQLAEVGVATFTARDYRPGLLRHVVLFRYRPEVTAEQKAEVLTRFRALAGSRRADGQPYVLSIEAGEQTSGEGAGGGFEHGIVVTFASEGDRNHYVGTPVVEDPEHSDAEHAAFKEFVGPLLAEGGVLVFDVAGQDVAGQDVTGQDVAG